MKIGIDIDGVIANFFSAYEEAIVQEAGVDMFPARYPAALPPVWDWPEHYGYDKKHVKRVWRMIEQSQCFWSDLGVLPDAHFLAESMPWAVHDVYFITARPGARAKHQTEAWLQKMLPITHPTVLLTDNKGGACETLKLDFYIDDKPSNVEDVMENSDTRVYLCPQYPYNQEGAVGARRAGSIEEVFRAEGVK